MSKEKLSKSEICGYCGSKIMWDVDDDNFEPSEEDKLHEDELTYIESGYMFTKGIWS